MLALLYMQKFIKRIPVGKPSRSFLIGAEQLSIWTKSDPDWKANSCANRLPFRKVWGDLLNRSAIALEIELARTLVIDEISIRVVCSSKPKVQRSIGGHGQSYRVDVLSDLFPTLGHHNFVIASIIFISIQKQRDLPLARYEHPKSTRVIGLSQHHSDRASKRTLVLVKDHRLIL